MCSHCDYHDYEDWAEEEPADDYRENLEEDYGWDDSVDWDADDEDWGLIDLDD